MLTEREGVPPDIAACRLVLSAAALADVALVDSRLAFSFNYRRELFDNIAGLVELENSLAASKPDSQNMRSVAVVVCLRHPLQVANIIVCLVFVSMIHSLKIVRIWNKRLGDQPVDAHVLAFAVFAENDEKIPVTTGSGLQKLRLPELQGPDSSKIRDFVESFIAADWFPLFFHLFRLYRALFFVASTQGPANTS